ncbi:hypothetical protein XM38_002230 [Halomicronema hongdechloris C2206]|uniref:Probable membrane transporter protein n=1 Tax=Halomicronema hongdechloris C2206 TaxID=1641165 RepID=A0A1Z3HGA5_9CYAN|nr:sulfite exporter TauE/SafE family protein [Halomicronema hongdechloris]ASC69296.1 hypothetical protein XM38_002230 [Halomicronema hongdechloris C2206]
MDSGLLVLLGAGVVAGILAGFLGIGGGTVLVPIMVALGVPAVQAVASSSLAIVVTSLSQGSLQNWRMGYLNLWRVCWLGLPALFTAWVGQELANLFPEYGLLAVFGLFLLLNIYLVGLRKQVVAHYGGQVSTVVARGTTLEPERPGWQQRPVVSRLMIGSLAGFLAGLFGVGGGVVMVPLQIVLLGEPIKLAVQTSLGAIVIIALAACGWHAISGNVQFETGLLLGVGGLAGAQISTRFLPKLPERVVSHMFRLLLGLMAVYFFWKAAMAG